MKWVIPVVHGKANNKDYCYCISLQYGQRNKCDKCRTQTNVLLCDVLFALYAIFCKSRGQLNVEDSFTLEQLDESTLMQASAEPFSSDNTTVCKCKVSKRMCIRDRGRNACPCKNAGPFFFNCVSWKRH